jgi:hypothetical protein
VPCSRDWRPGTDTSTYLPHSMPAKAPNMHSS